MQQEVDESAAAINDLESDDAGTSTPKGNRITGLYKAGPVHDKIGINHNIYTTPNGERSTWGVRVLLLNTNRKKRTLRGQRPFMIFQGVETMEMAAELHDRAVIAVWGRDNAVTNYPLSIYPEDVKRDGMDLEEYLLHLWNVSFTQRPKFRWKTSPQDDEDLEPLGPEPYQNAVYIMAGKDRKAMAQAHYHSKERRKKSLRKLYHRNKTRKRRPGRGFGTVACGKCENCLLEVKPCLRARALTARVGSRPRLHSAGHAGRLSVSALARRHTELFRTQEVQQEAQAESSLVAELSLQADALFYSYGQDAYQLSNDTYSTEDFLEEIVDINRSRHGLGKSKLPSDPQQSREPRCAWCNSAKHPVLQCPLHSYAREELLWQPHTTKGIQEQSLAYDPTSDKMQPLMELEPHEQVVATEVAQAFLQRSSLMSFTFARDMETPHAAVVALTQLLKEMAHCSLL